MEWQDMIKGYSYMFKSTQRDIDTFKQNSTRRGVYPGPDPRIAK